VLSLNLLRLETEVPDLGVLLNLLPLEGGEMEAVFLFAELGGEREMMDLAAVPWGVPVIRTCVTGGVARGIP
jgi:hypothetical protein